MKRVAVALALLLTCRRAGAVEGGAEDRVTTHAVAIVTGGPSAPVLRCSGTLISPNVVLTVRHCVAPIAREIDDCAASFAAPEGRPEDYWVDATPWVLPSSSYRRVSSWIIPSQSRVCGDDVALLVLASAYDESEATPARPVVAERELRELLFSRVFGLAAFGASSATGEGSGTRRSRFDIPVQCVPGDPSFDCGGALAYVDPTELSGGAGPCAGDSGGGAIAATDHGVVFGVLSRGDTANGTCASGVYERTDVWGWLIARTVLDATPAGRTPPAWARDALPDRPSVGERCRAAGACPSGAECVSFDGERSFVCAARCESGCGPDMRCESGVCAPATADVASPGGGCSPAPVTEGSALVRVAFILVIVARRARPERTLRLGARNR